MPIEKTGDHVIAVHVDFEGHGDEAVDAAAYLFDSNGSLIASEPINKGKVRLAVDRETADGSRMPYRATPD